MIPVSPRSLVSALIDAPACATGMWPKYTGLRSVCASSAVQHIARTLPRFAKQLNAHTAPYGSPQTGSPSRPVVHCSSKPVSPSCSALCVPIPPPQHTDINTLRKAGYGFQSRVPLATDGSHSQQGVSSPSSSSPSREHGGPESADRAERQVRRDSLRQLSKTSARPLAVLKAINNRGSGIFNEHEERALVRLCAGVETLLRRKAAEVSLLWSGMTERTLVRKSNIRGGPGGAWSNYARVESTIMRLYSEASFPADAVRRLRLHTRKRGAAKHHQRSLSDSTNNVSVDFAQESGSSTEVNPQGDGVGRQAVDDNKANRVHRMLTAEVELVDLSMSLFELGSDRLLSLVARFFRSMELTNTFKVNHLQGHFVLWVRFATLCCPIFFSRFAWKTCKTDSVNSTQCRFNSASCSMCALHRPLSSNRRPIG